MQGGDVSASGKSHPLRRNGSMARSFRHLGSDCLGSPSRDSSADAAPDGQVCLTVSGTKFMPSRFTGSEE